MPVRTASFLPLGAGPARFQPRVWLDFVGQEHDPYAAAPQFWGVLVCNGGPALDHPQLELHGLEDERADETHLLDTIPEGGSSWLFLGGPASEPPHGRYRLWAKGLEGAPVFLENWFTGFDAQPGLPEAARRAAARLAGPAAAWLPSEYLRVLERSAPLCGHAEGRAAAAFGAWWNERLELLRAVLSLPAAREAVWSGLQSVFGAAEADRERTEVARMLDRLAFRLESSLRGRSADGTGSRAA